MVSLGAFALVRPRQHANVAIPDQPFLIDDNTALSSAILRAVQRFRYATVLHKRLGHVLRRNLN